MQGIDNLIIDLGGVLYAIDVQNSIRAFARLMGGKPQDLEHVIHQMHHNPVWQEFEKGTIGKNEFRNGIRKSLGVSCENADIDDAWNALLIGPIEGRAEGLRNLAKKYRLILLSNTNSIHFEYLSPLAQSILEPFEELFLSFQMGARKPDPEIYLQVIKDSHLSPEGTLFIDDSMVNITGARAVGLKAHHVEANDAGLFTKLSELLG